MAVKFPDIIKHNNPYRPIVEDTDVLGGVQSVTDKPARNNIPFYKRKRGALVSYLDGASYITARYSFDDVSNANWEDDSNWETLSYVDQGVNTTDSPQFANLTINGDITIIGSVIGGGFLSSGDNVSELVNDAGYLTSIPGDFFDKTTDDTDDITEGTNKFISQAELDKLSGIANGAEANVNADWNAVSGDEEILNKPSIPTALSDLSGDTDDISEGDNKFISQTELDKLTGIEDLAEVNNISDADATDLTDSGETDLHTHDSDNINEGTTNLFLKPTQQDIDGDKDFQNELSVTERSKSGINSIAYALSVTVNFESGDIHKIGTLTGNITVNTSNVEDGQTGVIQLVVDATGGYTVASGTGTWKKYDDSAYDFADCNAASTKYHIFYLIVDSIIFYSIQAAT